MKKLTLVLGLALGISFGAQANKYKMDEIQLTQTFENSQEVTFNEMYAADFNTADVNNLNLSSKDGSKTRGGYLLRSFFCGAFAIHRYYMGTGKKYMWALYFCVPVAGGVAACVDFWGAVFSKDFYKKFENNDKWFVWLD
ncbi:MAG: hypothetical protein H0W73_09000 [Bacteroidetes bacterium]|nr:hypothetical protein [Bacteroidota bacterium]